MFSAHLTKFRFTILAVVALLAVIGVIVALTDSAEAGRRPLVLHSVDMTIRAATGSDKDNKIADMSFTWKAPGRATGYQIQRRDRINVADSPVGEAEWSGWAPKPKVTIDTASTGTITHTYSFSRAGKHVQWRIRLKDGNDNWGHWRNVNVSWGLKKKYQHHYLIKRNMFADP